MASKTVSYIPAVNNIEYSLVSNTFFPMGYYQVVKPVSIKVYGRTSVKNTLYYTFGLIKGKRINQRRIIGYVS